LIEKPSKYITAKVPMVEIGTASSGMIEARQVWQEQDHHQHDQRDGFEQRVDHGLDGGADELGRIIDDRIVHAFRHVLLQLGHGCTHIVGDRNRVRSGRLKDRNGHGRLVVEQRAQRVFGCAELDAGDIAQSRDLGVAAGLDDDVAEFFLVLQPALGVEC
jgi:hypothetical protein